GETPLNFAHGTLDGFCKTLSLEPGFQVKHIDTDPSQPLLDEILINDDETAVALRGSQRFLRRLGRFDLQPLPEAAPVDPKGTYLITGGFGGIGHLICQYLVQKGARSIVLVGRNRPSPEVFFKLQELSSTGAIITPRFLDI